MRICRYCVWRQATCESFACPRLTPLTDASDSYEDEIMLPYYIGLQPYGFYRWNIYTVPQQQLDGVSREVPVGKGVGGGSLINGLIWNRGNQESYNTWNELGNSGWGWNDLLPYFEKVSVAHLWRVTGSN